MKEHKKEFSYYGREGIFLAEKIEGSYLDPRVGEEIADWTGGAPPDKLMIYQPYCCIKFCVHNHETLANGRAGLNSMSFAGSL